MLNEYLQEIDFGKQKLKCYRKIFWESKIIVISFFSSKNQFTILREK